MATPIEEPEELTGSDVYDQIGEKVGSVQQLYSTGEDDSPSWVGIDVSTGMLGSQLVLVPLARIKHEDGQVRVPYDRDHLLGAPEVTGEAQLSEEEHASLSDYYAVGRGDQPAEDNPDSYAAQMPEESEPPEPIG